MNKDINKKRDKYIAKKLGKFMNLYWKEDWAQRYTRRMCLDYFFYNHDRPTNMSDAQWRKTYKQVHHLQEGEMLFIERIGDVIAEFEYKEKHIVGMENEE